MSETLKIEITIHSAVDDTMRDMATIDRVASVSEYQGLLMACALMHRMSVSKFDDDVTIDVTLTEEVIDDE